MVFFVGGWVVDALVKFCFCAPFLLLRFVRAFAQPSSIQNTREMMMMVVFFGWVAHMQVVLCFLCVFVILLFFCGAGLVGWFSCRCGAHTWHSNITGTQI